MKGYLFDTDIIITFLRGRNADIKYRVRELIKKKIPISMSLIGLGELYLGAFKSLNPPKNLALVNKLKEIINLIYLDEDIIYLYAEIQTVLEKAGQIIGDFDVLIAATAINRGLILVTRNEKHYRRIRELFGQLNFERW